MSLAPGQVLNNRYRTVELLGKGGFGAVYRAWDLNLKGPCAVKENTESEPAAQRQFEREASLLFNLRHPNLPKVIDSFSLPGQGQYRVMEYIEGEDLGAMLERTRGPLEIEQTLAWIDQVCEALVYLHSRTPPVIHRDLKPANIRITPEGQAILVDFGIAKAYDPARKTTQGARAATPGYAPIEQYGMEPTDARTDIYALGATLYHLLTREIPLESVARVRGRPLTAPRALNSAISPALESDLLKALEVMPEDRYQDMKAFQRSLRSTARSLLLPRGQPLTSTAPVSGSPLSSPIVPAPHPTALVSGGSAVTAGAKPLPWVWISAVSILVFVVIILLVFIFRNGEGSISVEYTRTARALIVETTSPASATSSSLTITSDLSTAKPLTDTLAPTSTMTKTPTLTTPPLDSGALMVLIPAGEFQMGSIGGPNDERPVHDVYLDSFYIDLYEVVNRQYADCVDAGVCQLPDCDYFYNEFYADHPVVCVDWNTAQSYCTWRGARLPTDAEWEKAARGGLRGKKYPWGNEAPVCTPGALNGAQYNVCGGRTIPIASFSANGFGLFDMAGNVWEWVADWYDSGYYSISPFENPTGPANGQYRVRRGGSWNDHDGNISASNRLWQNPSNSLNNIGFRCARSP